MTRRSEISDRPLRCRLLVWVLAGIAMTICGGSADVQGADEGDIAVVASQENPPYRMFSDGQPRGVFIDFLEAVLRRVNLRPRYHVIPFKRCLTELESGSSDLFVGLFYRPEREAFVIYLKPSMQPNATKVFYLKKARAGEIRQWEDLYRLRIGIRDGYKNHPDFDSDERIRKYGVPTDAQNFHKMAAGRIDAVLITEETGVYLIDKLGYAGQFEAAPLRLERYNPAYLVMSRKSRLTPRVEELQSAIAALVADGTYDAIRRRYLSPEAPY